MTPRFPDDRRAVADGWLRRSDEDPEDPAAEVAPVPHCGSRAALSQESRGAGAGVPPSPPVERDAGLTSATGGAAVRASAPSAASTDGVGIPPGAMAIAAAMKEDRGPDSLDARIRRLCEDLGLLRYHTFDSRRSTKGFPDLVICGPRGVLFRELKSQRGKVTAEQRAWLCALIDTGQDAGVWRPESLLSGVVAAELTAISAWNVRRGGAA